MTRRFLFARATGDLILCVDSDDYLKPEAIETAVEYLTRTDADMTFFCMILLMKITSFVYGSLLSLQMVQYLKMNL